VIRRMLCRARDAQALAADILDMRNAIAAEKGDRDRWDVKYAAGGLIDIEFIAQYLQLAHAWRTPDLLDTSTARVLDNPWRLGILEARDADVLRPRCGSIRASRKSCGSACRARSIQPLRRRASWRSFAGPPMSPTSPRSMQPWPRRRPRCAQASIGLLGRSG